MIKLFGKIFRVNKPIKPWKPSSSQRDAYFRGLGIGKKMREELWYLKDYTKGIKKLDYDERGELMDKINYVLDLSWKIVQVLHEIDPTQNEDGGHKSIATETYKLNRTNGN